MWCAGGVIRLYVAKHPSVHNHTKTAAILSFKTISMPIHAADHAGAKIILIPPFFVWLPFLLPWSAKVAASKPQSCLLLKQTDIHYFFLSMCSLPKLESISDIFLASQKRGCCVAVERSPVTMAENHPQITKPPPQPPMIQFKSILGQFMMANTTE
jgi:hypothetical protein